MTLGFFACLGEIEAAGGKTQLVGDLSGMFYRRPAASIGLTVCLLSLIGLPLTAGFWAKFMVFMSASAAGVNDPLSIGMGVLMAVNAVIAAGYYWRVLSKLFEKSDAHVPLRVFRPQSVCRLHHLRSAHVGLVFRPLRYVALGRIALQFLFPRLIIDEAFRRQKGLILGVANDRSIAWAVAKEILDQGGVCGFSHLPDKADDEKKKTACEYRNAWMTTRAKQPFWSRSMCRTMHRLARS